MGEVGADAPSLHGASEPEQGEADADRDAVGAKKRHCEAEPGEPTDHAPPSVEGKHEQREPERAVKHRAEADVGSQRGTDEGKDERKSGESQRGCTPYARTRQLSLEEARGK